MQKETYSHKVWARAAAHLHAGDLANVPRSHGLVEGVCEGEHALRHATTRARRFGAGFTVLKDRPPANDRTRGPCGRPSVAKDPPHSTTLAKTYSSSSQRGRRRTSMLVTLPTSHVSTGWLNA